MTKKLSKEILNDLMNNGITYRKSKGKSKEPDYYMSKKYGITIDDYNDLLNKQNGLCAICCNEFLIKKLCIDHDHITGKVRGLLCFRCNTGLGMFRDNKMFLRSAINYLILYDPSPTPSEYPLK